jgi:hypothetical protein
VPPGIDARVHPDRRLVVRVVEIVVGETVRRHTLDEIDALAPVIERGERSDHAHHRVGQAVIVRRHVGQVLDLADHVVAEIPHDAAVERGELGEGRGGVHAEQCVDRRQDPAIGGDRVGQITADRELAVPEHHRGGRVAADEREAGPALPVLDRLQQEPRLVADELDERCDRCLEIAEDLGPDGDDAVLRREGLERLP